MAGLLLNEGTIQLKETTGDTGRPNRRKQIGVTCLSHSCCVDGVLTTEVSQTAVVRVVQYLLIRTDTVASILFLTWQSTDR